jgi:hypothetical protein
MPKGIFNRDFNHDYRPKKAMSQMIYASEEPQEVKRELLDAAVVAGAAVEFKRRKTDEDGSTGPEDGS